MKVPGVGKKTAERLIIEMRDKLESVPGDAPSAPPAGGRGVVEEAVQALQALGYKPADADKMIARAVQLEDKADSASQLIRAALQATVRA